MFRVWSPLICNKHLNLEIICEQEVHTEVRYPAEPAFSGSDPSGILNHIFSFFSLCFLFFFELPLGERSTELSRVESFDLLTKVTSSRKLEPICGVQMKFEYFIYILTLSLIEEESPLAPGTVFNSKEPLFFVKS